MMRSPTLAELRGRHQQRGVDRPGRDRVGGDPVARVLAGDRLRERDHAALGGRVHGRALRAHAARLRGDVDDPPVAGLLHRGEHGVGAGEHALQVDREQAAPALRRHLREEGEVVRARVVDQDRERPVRSRPTAAADSGSVTSRWRGLARRSRRRPRGPPPRSGRRSRRSAPSAARRRAIAAPIPLAPPVTSAFRPSSLMRGSICARGSSGWLAALSSPPCRSPIPIIGGTGALGWGLAMRLAAGRASRW